MRKVLIASAVAVAVTLGAVLAVPLLIVAALVGSSQSAQACTGQPGVDLGGIFEGAWPDGVQVDDLSPTQMAHAATIVAVGEQLQVPDQGIVVALATASQESTFLNYANDGLGDDLAPEQRDVDRSLQWQHDAVGTNGGSVNAFQQQYPWWGTLDELMNPATAAGNFYEALLQVDGWLTMEVTVAAQYVQQSAYPGAYADDEPLARQLLAALSGSGSAVGDLTGGGLCGTGAAMDCAPTGLPVEVGLTPDALRVLRCVQATFGDHTYLGVGDRDNNPDSDHPAGLAVDTMIDDWDTPAGNTAGWDIAHWVVAHAAGLGVNYVIWDAQTWSEDRADEGWRPYTHPSGGTGPVLEHRNHVHVSVYGNAAGSGVISDAGWTLPMAPGTYTLTSGYGPRDNPTGSGSDFHPGLDFGADPGTPIFAAATGTVTFAGPTLGGYGNLVTIQTDDVVTYYAHQLDDAITVTTGTPVTAGQIIGAVGSTGRSTGPHLHFEVRINGATTDPQLFLRQHGVDPGEVQ